MTKILQLATYPISNPRHGGQIRVQEINVYLRGKGYEVHNLSISESGHDSYSADDLIISKNDIDATIDTPFCGDLATAILSNSGKYYEFIRRKIEFIKPDIIFIEQAWLWPAVEKYIKLEYNGRNIIIVYSSQNIEYITKAKILNDHGIDKPEIISRIYEIESDLCKKCDLAIAVSDKDSQHIREMGASNTIIAGNGARSIQISNRHDLLLSNALLGRRFAFLVGSAYPPNAMGFWKMVNHSLSFLKEDEVILVAGGVSDIIMPYGESGSGIQFQHNKRKIVCLGKIDTKLLDRLLSAASVILLPITSGGGSNLKTAEAIASYKPVVATRTACRGYDFSMLDKLTDFIVCDDEDSDSFTSAVSYYLTLSNPKAAFSDQEINIRDSVLWENTLSSLGSALNSI